MQVTPLDTENIYAHYDPIKKMVFVSYRKRITPQITQTHYQWLEDNLLPYRDEIRGSIYDFREVRHFSQNNISKAMEESYRLNRKISLDGIAAISIVSNGYQRQMIETLNKMSPGAERKVIVNSYTEAFAFMREWDQKQGRTPHLEQSGTTLDIETATAYMDQDTGNTLYTYYGVLDGTTTAKVYETIGHLVAHYGVDQINGGIFDFRHVTQFEMSNTRTVARSSTQVVSANDMSRIPVALLVDTMMQERMVITAMKVTPDEKRKRIVHSWSQAQKFLKEFHQKLEKQDQQQTKKV